MTQLHRFGRAKSSDCGDKSTALNSTDPVAKTLQELPQDRTTLPRVSIPRTLLIVTAITGRTSLRSSFVPTSTIRILIKCDLGHSCPLAHGHFSKRVDYSLSRVFLLALTQHVADCYKVLQAYVAWNVVSNTSPSNCVSRVRMDLTLQSNTYIFHKGVTDWGLYLTAQ